jgi:ornithine cyclodeaminase/alanine dehydrogenase-like protein (mu-crystallin family)
MQSLVLSQRDLAPLIEDLSMDRLMDEVIEELERAFVEHAAGRFRLVQRKGFVYAEPDPGVLEWMPILSGHRALVKIVSYNPHNPTKNFLPTIISTILVYDTRSGHLDAVLDGTFATALRTGAASAVATRALAWPESSIVGLVGCGTQAVTQLHALSRVLLIKRVLIYDTDTEAMSTFPSRVSFLGLDVYASRLSEVEGNSDVICTATSVQAGAGPVLQDRSLKPWLHVNAVGSDLPGKIELPLSLLLRSLVIPDFPLQAAEEGECQQLGKDEVGPSISTVLADPQKFEAARWRQTVFDSTGFAVEDLVVTDILLRHAKRIGLGNQVWIEASQIDPKDPYSMVMCPGNL